MYVVKFDISCLYSNVRNMADFTESFPMICSAIISPNGIIKKPDGRTYDFNYFYSDTSVPAMYTSQYRTTLPISATSSDKYLSLITGSYRVQLTTTSKINYITKLVERPERNS